MKRTESEGIAFVNGTRLYYGMRGSGPPVVLMHEASVDLRMWDDQMDSLSESFTVIRYDQRDHGRSDRADEPWSHTQDLEHLLRFLHLNKAALVAAGRGAAVAIDLAFAAPAMVKGMVLAWAAASGGRPSIPRIQARMNPYMDAYAEAQATGNTSRLIEHIVTDPYSAPRSPAARDGIRVMLEGNAHLWQDLPKRPLILERHARQRMLELRLPVLLLIGSEEYPDIAEITDELRSTIVGVESHTFDGLAHFMNMDAPEEFNRVTLEFLRRVWGVT